MKKRQGFLEQILEQFNDGRSRSVYCVAATLLSLEALQKSLDLARRKLEENGIKDENLKDKAKILKENLNETALKELIDLNLRKPSRKKQEE